MSTELENLFTLFTYHAPFGDQPERYEKIRNAAKEFGKVILECCPDCDDRDHAIKKLRMAVFAANAGIACNEKKEPT